MVLVDLKMGCNIWVFRFFVIFACFFVVFFGFLILEGQNEPKLVITSMDVILQNILAFLSFSSSDIKGSVSGVSLDHVSFMGPVAFIMSDDLKPAAVVFIGIGDDLCAVVDFVLENAETGVGAGDDEGEFFVLPGDGELLIGFGLEGADVQFGVIADCQAFMFIED